MDIRERRKWEHIKETLKTYDDDGRKFKEVLLIPQSCSNGDLEKIDLGLNLFGKKLDFPLIVNAMTGGAKGLEKYNEAFSKVAQENNLAMAVGSQKAALRNPELVETYSIVRKVNPDGVMISNLSALENSEDAKRAVDMIEADAIQLHINHSQEISMLEGDRDFSNLLVNVEKIINESEVPVIIKEVGTGMSKEAVKTFFDLGATYVDIGGSGGTNFPLIEDNRRKEESSLLGGINIPTPISIIEARSVAEKGEFIFATGGIRNSEDLVKSLALGADMVGIAAYFLKNFQEGGATKLDFKVKQIIEETKKIALILGVKKHSDFKEVKYILKNEVKEWIDQRL